MPLGLIAHLHKMQKSLASIQSSRDLRTEYGDVKSNCPYHQVGASSCKCCCLAAGLKTGLAFVFVASCSGSLRLRLGIVQMLSNVSMRWGNCSKEISVRRIVNPQSVNLRGLSNFCKYRTGILAEWWTRNKGRGRNGENRWTFRSET